MNAFESAKKENGSVVVGDAEYALNQQAYIGDDGNYQANAFSVEMMTDGEHDPMFDPFVTVTWSVDPVNGELGEVIDIC